MSDLLTGDEEDIIVATADLAGRSGARDFTVGHLHDGVPVEEAAWYAQVTYQGRRLFVEKQPGPVEACDALAKRLLEGGLCTHCGKTVTVSPFTSPLADPCYWRRDGAEWKRGCQ